MDSLNKTEQKYLKGVLKERISKVEGALKSCRARPTKSDFFIKHIAKLEKELVMLNKLMDKLEV